MGQDDYKGVGATVRLLRDAARRAAAGEQPGDPDPASEARRRELLAQAARSVGMPGRSRARLPQRPGPWWFRPPGECGLTPAEQAAAREGQEILAGLLVEWLARDVVDFAFPTLAAAMADLPGLTSVTNAAYTFAATAHGVKMIQAAARRSLHPAGVNHR